MSFAPTPVLAVGGVDVASSFGADGTMALAGFSVTWGGGDPIGQPEPATATVQVFDAGGRWATDTDLTGQPVTLRAVGAFPGSLSAVVMFTGRVAAGLTVRPATLGGVAGSLVTLPCQSVLQDLANRKPTGAYAAESVATRAARLSGELLATIGATSTPYRAGFDTVPVQPVAVADQVSLWDHCLALAEVSASDRLTYFPTRRDLFLVPRRKHAVASLGRLVPDPAGARASAVTVQTLIASVPGVSVFLDGHALEYDDGLTRPERISRAQVTHLDGAAGLASRTTEAPVPGVDETVTGSRTAWLSSIVTANATADAAAAELADLAAREGRAFRLEALRLRLPDGFDSPEQAHLLLYGGESPALLFIERSWLSTVYGLRPVVGLIGGTISFTGAGWDLTLQTAPVVTSVAQHAISWEEMDPATVWRDAPAADGTHESLTYEDLAHVGRPTGATVTATSQRWDTPA